MGSVYWDKLVPQITPPKVPANIEGLGIPASVVENLVLKHLSAFPKIEGQIFLPSSLRYTSSLSTSSFKMH